MPDSRRPLRGASPSALGQDRGFRNERGGHDDSRAPAQTSTGTCHAMLQEGRRISEPEECIGLRGLTETAPPLRHFALTYTSFVTE